MKQLCSPLMNPRWAACTLLRYIGHSGPFKREERAMWMPDRCSNGSFGVFAVVVLIDLDMKKWMSERNWEWSDLGKLEIN